MNADFFIKNIDDALRTLFPPISRHASRAYPAAQTVSNPLTTAQKNQAAALMRVNHAGEVCAQALYQGQALTAKLAAVKTQMNQCALEEIDHLAWCEQRLKELGHSVSILNPLWYLGSLTIGALAGLLGDKFSLGFVIETELQVSHHLHAHLNALPLEDDKSRVILKQMHDDEFSHAQTARKAGGIDLPYALKFMMGRVAKIMTKTSYYV